MHRNKWLLTAFVLYSSVSPVWSKSLGVSLGLITDSGQLNPNLWQSALAASAVLLPLDIALSLGAIYFFGKRFRRQRDSKVH